LGVEMDGRRFDVDVSDPFLNVYKQTVYDWNKSITNEIKTRRTILIRIKVTVKRF
jgi:hypothetical protein